MATHQLEYCKKCVNKDFDFNRGTICKLTNDKPNFNLSCPSFVLDEMQPKTSYSYNSGIIEGQATGWDRFLNYFIDRLIVFAFAFITGIILFLSGVSNISRLESYAISYTIFLLYYTLIESLTGQSIGKMATGTMVVTANGEKPDFTSILGRSFSRLIPFEAFSFLGESHSGWHDTITNTTVIKKSAYKAKQKINAEILDSDL